MTVTGCLKAGDSADSTVGTARARSARPAGRPAAVASATTLKIIPSGSTKLSEHVGHTVEVTGTVADEGAVGGARGARGSGVDSPGVCRPVD